MSIDPAGPGLTPSAALTEAADVAGYAPSIHNTQPWRWRVDRTRLELYAEPVRQLMASDPDGRLMIVSCGAALQHARTALAAQGWQIDIDRLPDRQRPELLARLTPTGHRPADARSVQRLQTIRQRHSDRRPVSHTPVAPDDLDAIRAAVEAEGAWLHVLRADDVLELATAADRAQTLEEFDPSWREEIAFWAAGARADGLGIPDAAILTEAARTTVPGRTFGRTGTLAVNSGHDGAATYAILFGADDSPFAWLRAGEALSAAWLTAIERGVSVLPMSATVEVEYTRQILRRLLAHLGEPFLAVRLGIADQHEPGPGQTPRLPAAAMIDDNT